MEEKKDSKGLLIGIIAFVAGVIFVSYGAISLLNSNKTPTPDDNNQEVEQDTDEPSVSITEDGVKNWLTDNAKFIEYFTDYNKDFDLGSMDPVSISNVFGWYFVFCYNHGEGEALSNSKYTSKYTMSIKDVDTFMSKYLAIPATIIDVEKIDFSKDVFNFTKDDNNYYVEVAATGLDPIQNCVLNDVNVVSDSDVEVTYGVMELGKTCENKSDECYTKKRKLTLRKADDGFTILSAADVKEEADNNQSNEENK